MVGITIGLFVVAAATIVSTSQLRDNRQLLLETQLQQDLRATADIIARELRRAGYFENAEMAVWNSAAGPNPTSSTQTLSVTAGQVIYDYNRPDNAQGPFQYSLESGVIKVRLSAAAPAQDLTDRNVMVVEDLVIELLESPAVRLECPGDCPIPGPAGETAVDYCWPRLQARELVVRITGVARSDSAVRRTIESRVRLRNDFVSLDPSNPTASPACPG